ncbi:glycosyltransferase family 8 protein [Myriangium duriaei CBS 260.36]|uniref:Glycosyltransferase family 8 protein n=1 Tax=Myriangium duriaei CBS 260.36 TaxID=1168546 RepID=A0A9P4JAG0_9PEZI|nr:glycosyltransferase family 8 protein [Myriangium duriaei CBS 260.36]
MSTSELTVTSAHPVDQIEETKNKIEAVYQASTKLPIQKASVISARPVEKIREFNAEPEAIYLDGVKSKYAFATLLAGDDEDRSYEDDVYLQSTRILTYQLLHANETRSRDHNIPFIVLVTNKTREAGRERLRRDGATVIEVPALTAPWIKPMIGRWDNVLTKLRLWELLDFERIAFLDADSMIVHPLDHIFNDPAVEEQTTLMEEFKGPGDKNMLPTTYAYGGNNDNLRMTREGEEPMTLDGSMCAGFFVMKPDVQMLRYYVSVLAQPESYDSALPEQSLFNAVHAWNGSLPWKQVDRATNAFSPEIYDVKAGVKSIHEKFWYDGLDPELRSWMAVQKGRMEGFFEARDSAKAGDLTL